MNHQHRAVLQLVTPAVAAPEPLVSFCGQCAHEPDLGGPTSRICSHCGMGVILQAQSSLAPRPGDAFLVVDTSLRVCALSEAAAAELRVAEDEVVHHPFGNLLELADVTEHQSVAQALLGDGGSMLRQIVVRPVGVHGVRYRARVGSCGEPRATLVVLDPRA